MVSIRYLEDINPKATFTVHDLVLFNQLITSHEPDNSLSLNLEQLEQLDKLVDVLGYDHEREIYYRKSRSLLNSLDQTNAVQTYQIKTNQEMKYQVPQNIAALK